MRKCIFPFLGRYASARGRQAPLCR